MKNLARWLYPLLLGGAWGSVWAAVTAWRQGPVSAVPLLMTAAAGALLLAIPAFMLAARPLVAYFFGSSGRTFVIIFSVVIAVGGPRLVLSPEAAIDAATLIITAIVIAGIAAVAARYALRRETPDSPNGLESHD